MGVNLVRAIQVFQALSTEEKPLTVPEGSTLHCVDTGDTLVFYETQWVLDLRLARAFKQSLLIP